MKYIVWICLFVLGAAEAFPQDSPQSPSAENVFSPEEGGDADSLYVSLITCSPGVETYTLFGHTAIHVRNSGSRAMDVVFNYGMFNYNSKNFIYRFVKGETDYELGAEPFDFFMERYVGRGFTVWEQELNLTPQQKVRLVALLAVNYLPENRVYRYNFLYDNCTSRAMRILLSALQQPDFQWTEAERRQQTTFRKILHRFTEPAPWTAFGIDMVLGAEVDRPLTTDERMFIPSVFQHAIDSVDVAPGLPFVRRTLVHQPEAAMEEAPGFPLSPLQLFYALLVLTIGLTLYDVHRGRVSLWFDVVLYVVQGVAGFLIAFLFFFSVHPAVGSNWLVVTFNPLVFLMIPDVLFLRLSGKPLLRIGGIDVLEAANMAGLLFALLLFCLPLQWLHPALLPLVLSLIVRSAWHLGREKFKKESPTSPNHRSA